jgi:hypothetical protein
MRSYGVTGEVVIAGLDPAIPIVGHGRAMLSGMAGSSPAMTTCLERDMLWRQRFVSRTADVP